MKIHHPEMQLFRDVEKNSKTEEKIHDSLEINIHIYFIINLSTSNYRKCFLLMLCVYSKEEILR